jgi:hypothetical protein
MIKIIHTKNRYGPIIRCDVCGEIIMDAGMAAVLRKTQRLAEGEESEVLYVHKRQCLNKMERQLASDTCMDEMNTHLMHLIINAGSSPAKLGELQRTEDVVGRF